MGSWKPLAEFAGLQVPPQDGPAWEPRKELGLVKALTETWKEVLFKPRVSFPRMKTRGGFVAPLLFCLTMMVIAIFSSTITVLIYDPLLSWVGFPPASMHPLSPMAWVMRVPRFFLVAIPLALGLSFLNAGIMHLSLALFKGTSKSYEATYRVSCYCYSNFIFTLVPYVGDIVATIWSAVSTIIGLSKVHRTEGWRAAAAVLLPSFVWFGIITALKAWRTV